MEVESVGYVLPPLQFVWTHTLFLHLIAYSLEEIDSPSDQLTLTVIFCVDGSSEFPPAQGETPEIFLVVLSRQTLLMVK